MLGHPVVLPFLEWSSAVLAASSFRIKTLLNFDNKVWHKLVGSASIVLVVVSKLNEFSRFFRMMTFIGEVGIALKKRR